MRKWALSLTALAVIGGGWGLTTVTANGSSGAPGAPAGTPASALAGDSTSARSGAMVPDETIALVEKENRSEFIDVGAKGESTGDYVLVRGTLRDDTGKKVGRVITRCMLPFKPDMLCDGVYKLRGRGDIVFANLVNTSKEPPLLGPIVGGDGDFANVGGQLRFDYQGSTARVMLELHYND
jgi:hypothetical protein